MKKISTWFSSGPEARYGFDTRGVLYCIAVAVLVLLAAVLHRALGFWFPNQSPIRLLERAISSALPSAIEHALSAFAVVGVLSLAVSGIKSTTRLRYMSCAICGLVYIWLSTFGWDWNQYRETHDTAQLVQMGGDIVGVVAATFWLTRPVRVRRYVRPFRLTNLLR